jgi:hypothetical protein
MSSFGAPEAIPLTGADAFLRAFDDEIRRRNGASHVSQLVLRLGPGFELERFRETVAQVASAHPILRSPIRRPLGLGAPAYRIAAAERGALPRVEVHDAAAPPPGVDAPVPPLFFSRLNERRAIRRGELLRFDVVRYAGGEGVDLAMSWAHMLFDGSGSERFAAFLDDCGRGEREAGDEPGAGAPARAAGRAEEAPTLGQRGDRARRWQRHVEAMGRHPVHSLAGPLRRVPQRLRYRVTALGTEESKRAAEAARARAGFLTPMLFYLAAAIRAHHAVFRARGRSPGSYVVPLPVNLRPKGAEGEIFRTHVSLLWFQVEPELAEDFAALLESLKEQRRTSIKAGLVEDGACAMDFARYAPKRLYAWMARRQFGGELCSFFFAYTGDFLGRREHFFGAPIRNGFHAAPTPPSPGSSLAFSLRLGRLNATHLFQEGVLSEEEQAIFHEQLLRDLAGAS